MYIRYVWKAQINQTNRQSHMGRTATRNKGKSSKKSVINEGKV